MIFYDNIFSKNCLLRNNIINIIKIANIITNIKNTKETVI